jgi:hypothetical protein
MGRRKKVIETVLPLSAEEEIQQYTINKFVEDNPDWRLYNKEYDVIPFMKGFGKGDLIFHNNIAKRFHIIECKNHSPKDTLEQAEYYSSWTKLQYPLLRVTYQAVVVKDWSIVYEMDINKAMINTITKIHNLVGLSKNELTTLSQLYVNLYVHNGLLNI